MRDPYVINRFFETPLITIQVSHHLATELRRTVATATDIRDRALPAIAAMADVALSLAERHTRDIGQPDTHRYRWEWDVHVLHPGAHVRPGAFWSFLYLLGDQPGQIRFDDPRLPWIQIEEPALRFREHVDAVPWTHHHSAKLTFDQAAMFPGWLPHHLIDGSGVRIDLWALLDAERAG